MKYQDQDSMGTCYANAMSVLLESKLGVPVSYHQLALAYGLEDDWGFESTLKDTKDGDKAFFSELGRACDSLKALRKIQKKICPRHLSPLENLLEQDADTQQNFFLAFGNLYDEYKDLNKKEKLKFKEDFKKIISRAKKETYKECNPDQLQTLKDKGRKSLGEIAKATFFSLGLDIQLLEEELKIEKGYSEVYKKIGRKNKVKDIEKRIKSLKKIQRRIGFKIEFGFSEALIVFSDEFIKNREYALVELEKEMIEFTERKNKELFFHRLLKNIMFSDRNHQLNSFEKKTIRGVVNGFDTYQLHRNFDPLFNINSLFACWKNNVLKNIREDKGIDCLSSNFKSMGVVFSEDAFRGIQDDYIFILNILDITNYLDRPKDDFFMSIFGTACTEFGLKIPKNTCEKISLPKKNNFISNLFKKSKKIKQQELKKTKKFLRNFMYKNLHDINKLGKIGNPVVANFCMNFFNEVNYDFNWGENSPSLYKCSKSGKHGTHSMTVVGMRCHEGRVQYKLQNSWGKDCGVNGNYRLKKFCDNENGTLWMDEEIFSENAFSLEYLK
ncbi:MAG: hypothetical protein CME61_02705 [Halobacteriovoraceae bacterium]|nr:hypothetical protein [Halobacteriovoraceae bacterium]